MSQTLNAATPPMQGLQALLAHSDAALPSTALLHTALVLGWCVVLASVLAWGGAAAWTRWASRRGQVLAPAQLRIIAWGALAAAFLLAALPGGASPVFWLGLSFQLPSLSLVLWCALALGARLVTGRALPPLVSPASRTQLRWLCLVGVVLGWALLMDTFALLPLPQSLYAWGFGASALLALAVVAVLPWLLWGRQTAWRFAFVVPLALLLFAVLRLPTGNVWDAVLDPLLWLVLHWQLMRRAPA